MRGKRSAVARAKLPAISRQGALSGSFIVLMAMAGILAAVALLTNSVPILVGSMIVAPLLPPLAKTAFGLAGGDYRAAARGFGTA